MQKKLVEFNLAQRTAKTNFKTGDVVKVYRKIKEGAKERIQVFEGMIIAIKGGQSSSPMVTVRKVSNGIGVELVLPVFSPNIEKIELVKRAKVRRSKLYYVRDKVAKALRFKFDYFTDDQKSALIEEEKEVEEVIDQKDKKEGEEVAKEEVKSDEIKKEENKK